MKVKFANKWYDVLDTRTYFGMTFYAIEDEPCHVDWITNPQKIKKETTMEERPVNNELAKFSTEALRYELKRRNEAEKARRELEWNTALRCRNCVHCELKTDGWYKSYKCAARTYGRYNRHYVINPSKKACEKFEYKNQ